MGRQVNFWMTIEDERELVAHLEAEDVVWTPKALDFGARPELKEWSDWRPSAAGHRIVCIQREDWPLLRWCDVSAAEVEHPWTMVGVKPSPAFDWDGCARRAGVIKRGRIYLKTSWLEDETVHQMPREVIQWFERFAGWIRRRGKPWKYSYQVVMPAARRAVRARKARLQEF